MSQMSAEDQKKIQEAIEAQKQRQHEVEIQEAINRINNEPLLSKA